MNTPSLDRISDPELKGLIAKAATGQFVVDESTALEYAALVKQLSESRQACTYTDLLAAALNVKGKPYTLDQHFMFEPMFRTDVPRQTIWKTARQVGKRLDIATPLPTSTGWTTMSEVQVGDQLLDEQGRTTVVQWVGPIAPATAMRVVFDDGHFVVADPEHLWTVVPLAERDTYHDDWAHTPAAMTCTTLGLIEAGAANPDRPRYCIPSVDATGRRRLATIRDIQASGHALMRCIEVDAPSRLYLAGRHMVPTHNTQSTAARGVILTNIVKDFSILFVTPLYEQIRRFSSNYVRPLIETSPLRAAWVSTTSQNNVLQRSFSSGNQMFFSFAYLDADRVRGIAASGGVSLDEVQDIHIDLVEIILQTMSASIHRVVTYTCTPKTLDNTAHKKWSDSSQAEWMIRCGCGKTNIPAYGYDVEKMIGPARPDVSMERPGVVCAACGRPIDPRTGRWVHRYRDRATSFAGYHIPQIIMPIHYAYPNNWADLVAKQRGRGNVTAAQFYNETLGESWDQGTKLVSETELIHAACLDWHNCPDAPYQVLDKSRQYGLRILAVDWGGGGKQRTSFTTIALIGLRGTGGIDVIWGKRLLTPHDPVAEAKEIVRIWTLFQCHILAHDYTGAGSLRETWLFHSGIRIDQVHPVSYVAAARQNLLVPQPATDIHPRNYWQMDKSRALVLVCTCIRLRLVRFFKWDRGEHDPGLISDFLALVENNIERASGSSVYQIVRDPARSDDFAQAVTIGCCIAWQMGSCWPNLPEVAKATMTESDRQACFPTEPWREVDSEFRGY